MRVQLPLLPLSVPLAERQRRQSSKLVRRVQLPQGTLGDRLTVGCFALNEAMKVRPLLPEPGGAARVLKISRNRGSANGRPPRSERGNGGSSPSPRAAGAIRKREKRPSSNLGESLWVRLPLALLSAASAGHRRAQGPVKPTHLLCRFNSCPTHCPGAFDFG